MSKKNHSGSEGTLSSISRLSSLKYRCNFAPKGQCHTNYAKDPVYTLTTPSTSTRRGGTSSSPDSSHFRCNKQIISHRNRCSMQRVHIFISRSRTFGTITSSNSLIFNCSIDSINIFRYPLHSKDK